MAFCTKCGVQLNEGANFCSVCGEKAKAVSTPTDSEPQTEKKEPEIKSKAEDAFNKFNNTSESTDEFDKADIQENKALAILSYLSILVFIPIIVAPKSKYVRFHANQGLLLLITEVLCSILNSFLGLFSFQHVFRLFGEAHSYYATPWYLSLVSSLLGAGVLVLVIIGIINAANGKAKELPIIGKYKILK